MLIRAALFVVLLTATALGKPPELDDFLPNDAEAIKFEGKQWLHWKGGSPISPAYRIVRDGVSFIVGTDDHQKIVYIQTDAKTFTTPEGVAVGSAYKVVLSKVHFRVSVGRDWAFWVTLPSGWNAAFVVSPQDPTPDKLPEDSRVSFFFKSDEVK